MNSEIQLVQPNTGQQWADYFELRWLLLRKPWNQPNGSERDPFDKNAHHVMATHPADGVIGVGRIHVVGNAAQIRYMAVVEKFRGQGIGTLILSALEQYAISRDVLEVHLNARENAVKFYQARDYQLAGDAPTLFGTIKHKKMIKFL